MDLDEVARSAVLDLQQSVASVEVDPGSGLRRRRQRRMGAAALGAAVVVAVGFVASAGLSGSPDLSTAASAPSTTVEAVDRGGDMDPWREFAFGGEFVDGAAWSVRWSEAAASTCLYVGGVVEPLCLTSEFGGDVAQSDPDLVVRRDETGAGYFIGRYIADPPVVVNAEGVSSDTGITSEFGPGGQFYAVGELAAGERVEFGERTTLGSFDRFTVRLTGAGFLCVSASEGESCTRVENVLDSAAVLGGFNTTLVAAGPVPDEATELVATSLTDGELLPSLVVDVAQGRLWVAAGPIGPAGVKLVFYSDGVTVAESTIGVRGGFDEPKSSTVVAEGQLWAGDRWAIDSDGLKACLGTLHSGEGGCADISTGEAGYFTTGDDFFVIGTGEPPTFGQAGDSARSFVVPRSIVGSDGVTYWLLRQGPLENATDVAFEARSEPLRVDLEMRINGVLCIDSARACLDTFGTLWAAGIAEVPGAGVVAFGVTGADLVPNGVGGIDIDADDVVWEGDGRAVWARQVDRSEISEAPPLEVRTG